MSFLPPCALRCTHLPTLLVLLAGFFITSSCTTRAFRFFPSSHHIPAFTKKNQVSAQIGFQNQHLAYSLTDHLVVKASFLNRIAIGPDTTPLKSIGEFRIPQLNRTGKFLDSELGFGYFNPAKWYMREFYFGGGFGKTSYHYNPSRFHPNQHSYHFYSTNYSLYGQYSIEKKFSPLLVFYLTYKTKWVYMGNIHGSGLDLSPDNLFSYGPGEKNEILWFNQLSATIRFLDTQPIYLQTQIGYSQPNKRMSSKNNRFIWAELSVGIRLYYRKKNTDNDL